jgi:hypothetical protein
LHRRHLPGFASTTSLAFFNPCMVTGSYHPRTPNHTKAAFAMCVMQDVGKGKIVVTQFEPFMRWSGFKQSLYDLGLCAPTVVVPSLYMSGSIKPVLARIKLARGLLCFGCPLIRLIWFNLYTLHEVLPASFIASILQASATDTSSTASQYSLPMALPLPYTSHSKV